MFTRIPYGRAIGMNCVKQEINPALKNIITRNNNIIYKSITNIKLLENISMFLKAGSITAYRTACGVVIDLIMKEKIIYNEPTLEAIVVITISYL